jgi:nucleoside-diphosphate kinase
MERTFVMVKPDGVRRHLVGEVIKRIEDKGYSLVEMKLFTIDEDLAKRHYAEHTEKPFFGELVSFITSGPVVAMVVEGDDAVKGARQIMGATNPLEAVPGSIRGDFASVITENIVHGSDSPESATREIGLFFPVS